MMLPILVFYIHSIAGTGNMLLMKAPESPTSATGYGGGHGGHYGSGHGSLQAPVYGGSYSGGHKHGRSIAGHGIINEKGYTSGYGGSRGDGSGLLNNSGGNARGHIGDTGIGAVVVTQDVLHKGDGKIYTSDESMRRVLRGGQTKSLENQIQEMQESALQDMKKSAEAKKEAAELEAKSRAINAALKKERAIMLQKAHENINKVLTSKKEELAKDIIPTVAVTPHSLGFTTHDKLALQRLNQVRKAAFLEGMSQKKNALLHENPHSLNPLEDVRSDPELIRRLYENAPINKKSAIVDPSKGRFSIINDTTREQPQSQENVPGDNYTSHATGGQTGGYGHPSSKPLVTAFFGGFNQGKEMARHLGGFIRHLGSGAFHRDNEGRDFHYTSPGGVQSEGSGNFFACLFGKSLGSTVSKLFGGDSDDHLESGKGYDRY